MSRRNILQILFCAVVIQIPIWCQARTRQAYLEQLTTSARVLLAANGKAVAAEPAPAAGGELDWPLLKELDPTTKAPSVKVKAFNNKKITLSGFMVPLEDKQQSVTEFLLVPSPMSCIHVPAPAPQQIVYVVVAKEKNTPVTTGAVKVTGTFYAAGNTTPNASSLYTMEADKVEVVK